MVYIARSVKQLVYHQYMLYRSIYTCISGFISVRYLGVSIL